ncbi:MAG: hypothetical protein PHP52_00710 [Bacteroidales bacterium]|nr:hypothetical protein [Bacteroidales bacterium]
MLINYILSKITFEKPFFIIGIDGPTASGKTYLADTLADELNKRHIPNFIYALDWTLKERSLREQDLSIFTANNVVFEYEADYHMVLNKAVKFTNEFITGFADGENISITELYDRDSDGKCTGSKDFVMKQNMVLIIEGHYTHIPKLNKLIDLNLLLLSNPEELLRRKIERAGVYRDQKKIEEYFRHVDLPSYNHYLNLHHLCITNICDNTNFNNAMLRDKSEILRYINSTKPKTQFKNVNLIQDFFSLSKLADSKLEFALAECVELLTKFDLEGSKLYGLAESVREYSYTEMLKTCFNKTKFKLQYFDLRKLYADDIEYFIVAVYKKIKLIFYARQTKIKIVLISDFSMKMYNTDRIFAQHNLFAANKTFMWNRENINISDEHCIIVPNKIFINNENLRTKHKVVYLNNVNPLECFKNVLESDFEFLAKFDSNQEMKIWNEIFNFIGLKPVFRDNYLYVSSIENNNSQIISASFFKNQYYINEIEPSVEDLLSLKNTGLKYIDGVISGEFFKKENFCKLYLQVGVKLKLLLWQWILRHYSLVNIFPQVSLSRLNKNLPSCLNEYYFALAIRGDSALPFFTVYDLRDKSLDISSYFRLASENNIAFGIQSSQNALDEQSGYLKIGKPENFALRISKLLSYYLSENPDKNLPLWALSIDHASAKMNKTKSWTKNFIKSAFSKGMITSICLDLESAIEKDDINFNVIEKLMGDWLSVIPEYVDMEITTGENINQIGIKDFENLCKIIANLMSKRDWDKSTFLIGPALGTVHHFRSDNTNPEKSLKVFNATVLHGNNGNVLHGTSFTELEVVRSFVKNKCVRINFAGQYLRLVISSLPKSVVAKFGTNQFEWKTSFAKNKSDLDNLSSKDYLNINKNIEQLFLKHNLVMNNPELDKESSDYFRHPVIDIPEDLLEKISQNCFNHQEIFENATNTKPILFASMIEVPDDEFEENLAKLVWEAGIKNFHVDVGDGVFIPRIICGLNKLSYLIENFPDVSIHVHIMANSPHLKKEDGFSLIEQYAKNPVKVIYLHQESFKSISDFKIAIEQIVSNNIQVGIVFNPDTIYTDTKFDLIRENNIHYIQFMGVFPGRGGQSFISEVLNNVVKFRLTAKLYKYDLKIEVDGGLTKEIISKCKNAGANFLSGWSMFLIYGKNNIAKIIKELLYEI